MRPVLRTLSVAALALACAVPAHAGRDDGFRGHGGHGGHGRHGHPGIHHGGGHVHGGHFGHNHGHRGGHHHGGRNWAPWVVGGLIGAAIIGAANAQAAPAPAPVVLPSVPVYPVGAAPAVVTVPSPLLTMPPVASHQLPAPVAPPLTVSVPQPVPPRVHFYCVPAQAYFPTVGSCPVPWQVVPY